MTAAICGMMVLHGEHGRPRCRAKSTAKEVLKKVRVKIVGDHLRLDFQHAHQVLHRVRQRPAGSDVVQIANVLGNKSFITASQADSVLEQPPQASTERPAFGNFMARGV